MISYLEVKGITFWHFCKKCFLFFCAPFSILLLTFKALLSLWTTNANNFKEVLRSPSDKKKFFSLITCLEMKGITFWHFCQRKVFLLLSCLCSIYVLFFELLSLFTFCLFQLKMESFAVSAEMEIEAGKVSLQRLTIISGSHLNVL